MTADESQISLSISLVSHYSSPRELTEALGSIGRAVAHLRGTRPSLQTLITLVDNSESSELRLAWFDALRPDLDSNGIELRLLSGHGNIGYGRGQNLAIKAARSDYHLLLNPDVQLAESSLVAAVDYLAAHPGSVLISPYAEDAAGHKQYLCKRYPSVLTFFVRGFMPRTLQKLFRKRLSHFEMRELPEDEATSGIPIASGCCMLCRTAALQNISGFDERYFLYFEDFDLSLRLATEGDLVYLPQMKIVHSGGNSARKGWKHIRMFIRSATQFFSQHGWRVV